MPRNWLENALEKAILEKDCKSAHVLIEMIQEKSQESTPVSLASLNKNNKSFLCLALEAREKSIADELLDLQQNNSFIIFGMDDQLRSLVWHAAARGYDEMIKRLIMLAKEQKLSEREYKIWLKKDIFGQSPLHIACKNEHLDTVTLLLQEMAQDENALNFINDTDHQGNTPLHLALRANASKIVEQLILAGASINICDNKSNTYLDSMHEKALTSLARYGAFIGQDLPDKITGILNAIAIKRDILLIGTLIGEKPASDRIPFAHTNPKKAAEVFPLFEPEEQTHILLHSKHVLECNNALAEVKKFYFLCLGAHKSLLDLLIAHHEFNEEIKPKSFYHLTSATNIDKKSNSVTIDVSDPPIPEGILKLIPRYAEKIMLMEQNNREVIEEIEEASEDEEEDTPTYQMLSSDREIIHGLINDIDHYLTDLHSRPGITSRRMAMIKGALLPILYGLAWAGTEAWMINRAVHTPDCLDYYSDGTCATSNPAWVTNYLSAFLGTGMGGLVFGAAPVEIGRRVYRCLHVQGVTIAHTEWRGLIDRLEQAIIEKLQYLAQRELSERDTTSLPVSYLPTGVENVQALEEQVSKLREDKPISQVIPSFTRIRNVLETIQTDMNVSGKPISQFNRFFKSKSMHDFVMVSREENDEIRIEIDEETPLMRRHAA